MEQKRNIAKETNDSDSTMNVSLLRNFACLLFIVISIAALPGCSSMLQSTYKPNVSVHDDGTLRYSGRINFSGFEVLEAAYNQAVEQANPPQRLVITSKGGNALAGILMGNFIHDKGLDVVVSDHCISACAAYVFPAGERQYLTGQGMVLLHHTEIEDVLTGRKLTNLNSTRADIIHHRHKAVVQGLAKQVLTGATQESKLPKAVRRETSLRKKYYPQREKACAATRLAPSLDINKPIPKDKNSPEYLAMEKTLLQVMDKTLQCYLKFRADQQEALFSKLDVDKQFISAGLERFDRAKSYNPRIQFYFYDDESLARFGFDDLEFSDNWYPFYNRYYDHSVEVSSDDW